MNDVTKLLEKVSEGDRQAQGELFCLIRPELDKLAWHWISRYHAKGLMRTTDVIDRAFERLMRISAPGWRHRGHFYSFASSKIFSVVIDRLREIIRLRKRERQPSILPSPDDPEKLEDELDIAPARSAALTLHTLLTLQAALEDLGRNLSEQHRVVVELIVMGECTLDEVAEVLPISRDKAFRMNRFALKYLREKLRSSFPDLASLRGMQREINNVLYELASDRAGLR